MKYPYYVLIPSYKREQSQRTLDMLSGEHFPKDRIIISTQTPEDYEAYEHKYGERATIIYQQGYSVGDNRNTLLQYCEKNDIQQGIMMDDDITALLLCNGRKIDKASEIDNILTKCVERSKRVCAKIWGVYPISNEFYMKKSVSVGQICIGTIYGVNDNTLRFRREFRVKEDYELCLRTMSNGGVVLRYNWLSPIAGHKTKGGCSEEWKAEDYNKYADWLISLYPEYVSKGKKQGEIKLNKR